MLLCELFNASPAQITLIRNSKEEFRASFVINGKTYEVDAQEDPVDDRPDGYKWSIAFVYVDPETDERSFAAQGQGDAIAVFNNVLATIKTFIGHHPECFQLVFSAFSPEQGNSRSKLYDRFMTSIPGWQGSKARSGTNVYYTFNKVVSPQL